MLTEKERLLSLHEEMTQLLISYKPRIRKLEEDLAIVEGKLQAISKIEAIPVTEREWSWVA